jgi:hypothetical protein
MSTGPVEKKRPAGRGRRAMAGDGRARGQESLAAGYHGWLGDGAAGFAQREDG